MLVLNVHTWCPNSYFLLIK